MHAPRVPMKRLLIVPNGRESEGEALDRIATSQVGRAIPGWVWLVAGWVGSVMVVAVLPAPPSYLDSLFGSAMFFLFATVILGSALVLPLVIGLRGGAFGHRFAYGLMAMVPITLAASAIFGALNFVLDERPPAIERLVIERKFMASGSKTPCRVEGKLFGKRHTVMVECNLYRSVAVGDILRFHVHAGALGYRWIGVTEKEVSASRD